MKKYKTIFKYIFKNIHLLKWVISEHACYSMSFPVVSLYDSYGKESIKYILNHGNWSENILFKISINYLFFFSNKAEIKCIFVDNFERVLNILDVIKECPHLKLLVYFDSLTQGQLHVLEGYKSNDFELVGFNDLMVSRWQVIIYWFYLVYCIMSYLLRKLVAVVCVPRCLPRRIQLPQYVTQVALLDCPKVPSYHIWT